MIYMSRSRAHTSFARVCNYKFRLVAWILWGEHTHGYPFPSPKALQKRAGASPDSRTSTDPGSFSPIVLYTNTVRIETVT